MRAKSTALGLAALALCGGCGGGTTARPAATRAAATAPPAATRAAASDPSLVPTRIGRGPRFQPPARTPAPESCAPGPVDGRFRAHVELFGDRRVVIVPAGIGLRSPLRDRAGRVVAAGCRAALRTLEPTGVVDFDRAGLRLGDLFAVWDEPLGPRRLLSFRGPVSVFVGGRRVAGDPVAVALRDGAEIVVEAGGYIPPHRTFAFPPRRVSP